MQITTATRVTGPLPYRAVHPPVRGMVTRAPNPMASNAPPI